MNRRNSSCYRTYIIHCRKEIVYSHVSKKLDLRIKNHALVKCQCFVIFDTVILFLNAFSVRFSALFQNNIDQKLKKKIDEVSIMKSWIFSFVLISIVLL